MKINVNDFLCFYRYALVGGVSNFLGFIFYLVLSYFLKSTFIVLILVYSVSCVFSFFCNKQFTFRMAQGRYLFLRFLLAQGLGFVLNVLIMQIFSNCLHVDHRFVQVGAIFIVAIFLFIVQKKFVFINQGQYIE